MKPGDIVRMNAACKRALYKTGSHDHVREFGRCYGVVIGLTDYGNQQGPEWDVRWQPSDLRYAYDEKYLVPVPLKAYRVEYEGDPDFNPGCIVYAYTRDHARSLGAYEINGDFETLVVTREWKFEPRAALRTEPGAEDDAEFMRDAGWRYEDEWTCGSCGLGAFGLEQYGVCRMCNQCKECGCEEDCDQSEGFSCE